MTLTDERASDEILPWWEGPLPDAPSARIICDSIGPAGHRFTTFEMKFHRFVLAEVNTHTLLSRNSESSRAVPYPKKRRSLMGTPALPLVWAAEQSGMQGGHPLSDEDMLITADLWNQLLVEVIEITDQLSHYDPDADMRKPGYEPEWPTQEPLHKSIVNRLLEPWMWHTATVSAVDWAGFFAQRSWNHTKLAQPEFGSVATLVEDLYLASEPTEIGLGGWHLPYVREEEYSEFKMHELRQLSTARCARTSYLTHTGERLPEKDFEMFERLKNPGDGVQHASPFQHVATPEPRNEHRLTIYPEDYGCEGPPRELVVPIVGNARGWLQFRHIELGW
jgi:hypothetical protein